MRCPDCGAEMIGSSGFCTECGGELPRTLAMPSRSRWLFAVAILGALAVCCLAGGLILTVLSQPSTTAVTVTSPTPEHTTVPSATATSVPQVTPELLWRKHESPELGVSLRHPEDWFVAEDSSLRQVVFASEEENLQVSDFLRGTSLALVVSSPEDLDVTTAEEAVQRVAGSLSGSYPSAQVGQTESCRIGGHDGARISFEGEFSSPGERLKGWVAAAVAYDYVYVFAAAAPVGEWTEQQTILQAMLDSVELSEPQPALVTPTSTPVSTAVPSTPTPTPTPVSALPVPGPDQYEPDDSIASAGPIVPNGPPQTHNLHTAGDRDYIRFEVTDGKTYIIETFDLGAEIDTIIYLLDSGEQEIARNDDATDTPLASRIIWTARSSGTYYVMIRDLAEDSSGPDATYSISVTETSSAEGADPYEPDDAAREATPIDTNGTPQTHTFHTTTDLDYISFVADGGVEYEIQTGNLQAECDTLIFLYDEAGTELDYDDDAGEEGFESRIVWTAPSSGVYYVKIRDFAGRAGPNVSYQIWVSTA